MRVLITCEHGGNKIPPQYRPLFATMREALRTHRGYDPGALSLARDLAKAFDAELVYSTTSRLLVELNRSPHHKQLFSEASGSLPVAERERLLQRYYWPYRQWVETQIAQAIDGGERAVHISSHSFTPQLHGEVRRADIGLLYDPSRRSERDLCRAWQSTLRAADGALRVRRNYPYRGSADGLTTHLRSRFPDGRYTGVEVEVNQKHTLGDGARWRELRKLLVDTLRATLVNMS